MKKITLLGLIGIAFFSLAQPTWAGPRGGGGGGHFGGGGHVGGFVGGGSRAAQGFRGGGFRGAPAFQGGGFRGTPAFRGAYFNGRTLGRPSAAPRFYYGRSGMPGVRSRGFAAVGNRPIPSTRGRISTIGQNRTGQLTRQNTRVPNSRVNRFNQQPNRAGSIAGRTRVSDPRTLAANRQSFVKNRASEQHNGNNWHRDWDRHHAHFHNHKVFVFVNGFWWGLNPWDYPYYAAGYPYDYYGDYPYDYSGSPNNYDYSGSPYDYGYYNYYPYSDDDQSDYAGPGQSTANATVSTVQSELARLGYYNGAIDGALGDQTEAALARYQQDRDLSVTGTVDSATLQSLGIK